MCSCVEGCMTADESTQLAELFRLLGEPNRLRLVAACLDGPRTVGDLTAEVGISQSLVSQHLRLLRAGRLLKQERSGRNVFVNRRPKRTPYRRAKGTPFVEQRNGYDGRTVRAGCGVGRA
ncbi:metalloregulator ArsR/SmtB family transcription factor [Sphingomonas sp. NIC1]|uniref:ArsR/SmtB family transcription factor n=1 Tax=Sphingomonas sp. NIC1 TaxID=1961362 RepID=UPI00299DDD48|nr:metalloregulator ArsR/SmtB family transcription factor [Sphingomonas sp. NIC1]